MDEEAVDAGDLRVVLVCGSGSVQAASDRAEVGDDEPGWALRAGANLSSTPTCSSCAPAGTSSRRGPGSPRASGAPPFRAAPRKRPRLVVEPGRRRHLDVIDPEDRHARKLYHRWVAAELEDTLVRGYRRLAAETPRRRIDLELRALDLLFATLFGLILLPVGALIALASCSRAGGRCSTAASGSGAAGTSSHGQVPTLEAGRRDPLGPYLGAELVRLHRGRVHAHRPLAQGLAARRDPQLWNVLKGDMSFVGPRPIRAAFFAELASGAPAYWQRLVVRPGLTGFAQVRRGYETSMAEKLAHDLEWIADRSVRLYLRTLVSTGFRVLGQTSGREREHLAPRGSPGWSRARAGAPPSRRRRAPPSPPSEAGSPPPSSAHAARRPAGVSSSRRTRRSAGSGIRRTRPAASSRSTWWVIVAPSRRA